LFSIIIKILRFLENDFIDIRRTESKRWFEKKIKLKKEKMTLILDYLLLCGFMFGFVTALYIGFKTIKLI
jgi:hypothetical protein